METAENLSHSQLAMLRSQIKKANEEKRLESYRKRLDKIITTKIRTSFIGALANFEESFGFLWGQDKSPDQLTDEERQMKELWEQTRTSVLNNGNAQLRAAQNEISQHVISWNRHHVDLVVKPKEESND